ncbi:GMC oxidoreductase [Mycolicibacterium llatzerense]|uniref:GMC oxidoreductase n=1 Tax=Mycolicibacterium llatzerense TaxID=280871 RepID=UPI0021B5D501|nr:GMC oxidoreductase [Mycolicibacterium llatzerense]MCT7369529.1 cholesterol oxidase [Mycolicibacterium llatzerense]
MSPISRRQFLGGAAVVGVAGAAGVGVLVERSRDRTESRKHFSAIVIGSGYGGGVSALRLGQAGIETLVIEQGRLWDKPDDDGKRFSKMLPADTRAGWFTKVPPSLVTSFGGFTVEQVAEHAPSPQPIQAGICQKVTHGAHDVFRGLAVGGGSMINAGIAAIPTPRQVAKAFPDIGGDEFLRTYVERAKSALKISYRDMPWFEQAPCFQYARVGRKYAAAAGYKVDYNGSSYSFDYLVKEAAGQVPQSSLAFEQQFGSNYGRFGSVDQTYIAEALKTGHVTLRPLTEVTSIRQERSGEFVVSTREIDRWGKELSKTEFGCDQLYLAAGVLGTTKLLLKARETGDLARLGDQVGKGYGNNGDLMVGHNLAKSDPAGTTQSLMGMINIDGRDDPDNPVYASMFSMPLPVETYLLGYYVMVDTGDRADITYDRQSDTATIQWTDAFAANNEARARLVFDKIVRANKVDYRNDLFSGKVFAPNTVHPLGGCVRGKATDAFGRVNGHRNLFVNDASLMPGHLGCNPYMTITALAERNIEGILQGRT